MERAYLEGVLTPRSGKADHMAFAPEIGIHLTMGGTAPAEGARSLWYGITRKTVAKGVISELRTKIGS